MSKPTSSREIQTMQFTSHEKENIQRINKKVTVQGTKNMPQKTREPAGPNYSDQNRSSNNGKRKKVEFTSPEKENKNTTVSTQKKHITPTKTTGTIRKTNFNTPRNTHFTRKVVKSRVPLADLVQNQKHHINRNKNVESEQFKKPALASKLARTTTVKRALDATYTRLNSTVINLNDSSFGETWIKATVNENSPSFIEDSAFWTSFLTVNHTLDWPHKRAPNFGLVRRVTVDQPIYQEASSVTNQSIVHDSIPSLRKKTLKKQVSQPSGYLGVVNLDFSTNKVNPAVLYTLEYMNDIIFYIITKQEANILKPQLFDQISNCLDQRAHVINWLVKLHYEAGIFFMSVRIFDKILTLLDIPQYNYQLTAIAAYWISVKYNTSFFITGRTLIKLCNYAFTLQSLLEMERDILLILQFDVVYDDPVIFVHYYINILQLRDCNMVAFSSNYLLELLTLDFNCNTYPLSLQAASAIFLSLKFLNIKDRTWKRVGEYFGYHDKKDMFEVQKIIIKNIILINHEDCPYKESLQKYSSEKYGKVSLMIPKILERWYNVNDISLLVL